MSSAQKAVSAMIWDFLGKGGLSLVRFAESILLVRLLGNTDYGILSVLLNFQASLVLAASLGIEGALSRFLPELQVKKKEIHIPALIRQAGTTRSCLLITVSGICFLFAAPLVEILFKDIPADSQPFANYLRFVLFLVISVGLQDLTRRILVIHYKQRLINTVEFFAFCAYLGGAIILIQLGGGITEVLLVNIGSKLLTLLFFAFHSRFYFRSNSIKEPVPSTLQKRIYAYALSFYFYSLMLHVLGKGGDIFILGALDPDISQVTFYTIAFNFAFFSTSFFELALHGGFVLPFISEIYHKGNRANICRVYTGLFEFIYLFTIPISVGGIFMARELIDLFYGVENSSAAPLLILFFVHFSVVKIGILNSSFMLAADQQNRLIGSRVFFGGFNMVINLILVGSYHAIGVVWGTLITGVLSSIYETWCVHQTIKPRYSLQFMGKILLAASGMGFVLWGAASFLPELLSVKIVLLIGLGGAVYAILLVYLKPISSANLEVLQQSKLPFKHHLFRLLSK
ncbi:MAG: polysaccharide biosynthesis C-terminal domain-containing protein [SAR324 cluster bacterium]|nr:polysaccharide biosynthesis C-terminal domain-containing protein [SAR324 cluster bacterium]